MIVGRVIAEADILGDDMNTFSDIFKKSFLEGFSGSNITTAKIVVTLLVTSILALYIFCVYYFSAKKTFYVKSFNISLALIAVITSGILLAMQSNLVISLGMVGALSIVRFRTAIKDPTDLMFLFWSISVGIICGAQMFKIAILMSLLITAGLFLLELTPAGRAAMILVVNLTDADVEDTLFKAVSQYSKSINVRSRNITGHGLDMIIEVRSKNEKELLKSVAAVAGVEHASLMQHDGELTL